MRSSSQLILLLCLLFAGTARAATVSLTVGSGTAAPGAEYAATVSAAGGASLGALQFQVTWDPAVLEFKSVEKGKVLASDVLMESNVNAPGKLSVACVAQDALVAEGTLLTLKFGVKGEAGAKTTIGLADVKAAGMEHAHAMGLATPAAHHLIDVQANAQAGTFEVSSGASAGSSRALLYAGGLIVGVLVLAVLGKKLAKRT
jgi:hypothetical protein